jgi:hypothetical protein
LSITAIIVLNQKSVGRDSKKDIGD